MGGETWWLGYTETGRDIDLFIACFLSGSVVKKKKNPPAVREMQIQSLSWEDPLEEEMATHSSNLAW